MTLKLYNTLTRKVEEFIPLEKGKVKLFVCGLTPYDSPHIGHAKTYVAFDIIVRYLRYSGYKVMYLQNVTDIEDRLIQRSIDLNIAVPKLVEKYMKEYGEMMKNLKVISVDKFAYATHYLPQIIEQIKKLVEKGYAYEIDDGLYYDISKFEDYGKLSRVNAKELQKHRVEPNPQKKNPADFALWKKQKPGEPTWDSPWGKGRPGWHIEDTAISIKEFGNQYDLHGGGQDLIFPHHEAEIAQAEAFTGKKPFVKYWMHTGWLMVEGEKMSKSLGNFTTINDAIKKYGAEALRQFFASTPYRQPVDYTETGIEETKKKFEKVHNTLDNLAFLSKTAAKEKTADETKLLQKLDEYKQKFIKEMDNDFGTAGAIAVIFEFVRDVNGLLTEEKLHNKETIQKILGLIEEFDSILGLGLKPKEEEKIPAEVLALVEEREKARKEKNFKLADELREKIKKLGWQVDDAGGGAKVKKLK